MFLDTVLTFLSNNSSVITHIVVIVSPNELIFIASSMQADGTVFFPVSKGSVCGSEQGIDLLLATQQKYSVGVPSASSNEMLNLSLLQEQWDFTNGWKPEEFLPSPEAETLQNSESEEVSIPVFSALMSVRPGRQLNLYKSTKCHDHRAKSFVKQFQPTQLSISVGRWASSSSGFNEAQWGCIQWDYTLLILYSWYYMLY